jgi:hypothetical protein
MSWPGFWRWDSCAICWFERCLRRASSGRQLSRDLFRAPIVMRLRAWAARARNLFVRTGRPAAWTLVGVPLAWGILKTLTLASQMFR